MCVSGCTPSCVFQGVHRHVCFRVYTDMCVSGCTLTCVFQGVHHHVVCFGVYTMLCVSGCTPTCVFQGVHRHVCFRVYTDVCFRVYTDTCVSGCTPTRVFQGVHRHVCFRVYTTMLGKKASLAPLKEILRRHKVSGNWCRLALNPFSLGHTAGKKEKPYNCIIYI